MIPILYQENETNFNHNGIGALYDAISYTVTEERNGSFELELEYPAGGRWMDELKDFRLIAAKPNDEDASHLFRIYEIIKNLEDSTIVVYAASKTNDLGGNLVQEVSVSNVNAQAVLTAIKNNLVDPTSYTFVSDIPTLASSKWINENPLSCIVGSDGSVINRWGGEIKRTDSVIYLYARRGTDRVTTIRQGKGLTGFKMTTSTKGMVTSVLPYVTFVPKDSETPITIRGNRVDSPLVSNYPIKYIAPVDLSRYDEIFPGEENLTPEQYNAEVLANINALAGTYFTTMNPGCDKPKVSIEVDLGQLSDSSEYEKFKKLEHIALTDSITVWVEKFNVDVEVIINTVEYNGMSEMVQSFKAGNAKMGLLEDSGKRYADEIDKVREYVDTVEYGIYNTIRYTADSNNRIFSGYTQPSESLVKENDLWYKPVADGEIEMFRWDGVDWILAVTNADKIVIGSIDASVVNLMNLNANNISTGTVQGAKGAWNLNSGELWLGSSKEDANFYWNGDSLSIKLSTGETIEEYTEGVVSGATEAIDGRIDDVELDVDKYNEGKLKGVNYDFTGSSFNIGGTTGDKVEHNNLQSKYTHADGSYTQIGVDGLERVIAGSVKPYNYLVESGYSIDMIFPTKIDTIYVKRYITLPSDFHGKDFKLTGSIKEIETYELSSDGVNHYRSFTHFYAIVSFSVTPQVSNRAAGIILIQASLTLRRLSTSSPEFPPKVVVQTSYMVVL